MKLVPAVIERAKDGTYSAYCENECFSGMGNTLEVCKNKEAIRTRAGCFGLRGGS